MAPQSRVFYFILLALVVSGNQSLDLKSENYFIQIDKLIEKSIHQFEHEQNKKMKAGFTSDTRRSYKKTKYSLAMEARNEIFKNALMSLQNLFPDTNENELAKDVLHKMPSHFDAFGAKRSTSSTEGPPKKRNVDERELDKACQGFPLHLPGHVEPCRDNVNIQCNAKDQRIRRINGECNNLNNKRWGAQVLPLQRLLPRDHEKFQIPLHDVEQNTANGKRMKKKSSGNGDELIGEWKATKSGTIITCARKPPNNNEYTCAWGNHKVTVTWEGTNYMWNYYPSVTGTITNNLMTWSTGSKWEKQVPICHPDCAPSECQNTTASLPNARFASATLHSDANNPERNVTNLLMQFAQFVDHDISLSPEATTADCCKNPYQDECMAIMIPENDAFFRQLNNQTCMQFTRSVPYCPDSVDSCTKRENMNIISGLLDTSNVYGSDTKTANCLRSFKDGKLLVDEQGLLPVAGAAAGGFGVQAGDARAPEMPALSAMHALWMREHNRICDLLKKSMPPTFSASDEYLYQNARRILNAEFQNVVYGEQIPIVEGPESVEKYNLGLSVDGSTYNPAVNPSILAEFSTASNRYGHSLVQGLVDVHNIDLSFSHTYQLADNFLRPTEYNGDGFDKIFAGLTQQPTQKFDRFMTKDLTQRMFRGIFTPPGSDYGLDLASLNIQRGRDHGLPSYYELYNLLGDKSDPKKDMSCWQRRPRSFNRWNWDLLKKVYKHPRDIELFSGGLLDERPNGINANPILGSMFGTINSIQFSRLKDGDRFFFTHTNGAAGHNRAAREAIMARKMSDIICDNTKVTKVPKNAFLPENNNENPLVVCGSHTPLNIAAIELINV